MSSIPDHIPVGNPSMSEISHPGPVHWGHILAILRRFDVITVVVSWVGVVSMSPLVLPSFVVRSFFIVPADLVVSRNHN